MPFSLFSHHASRITPAWAFDAKSPIVSPAAVAVMNGEERIIVGTKNGQLICLNAHGEQLWSFGTGEKLSETESYFVDEGRVHSFDSLPLIEDVNRDGKPEILAGTELGTLYCISLDGKMLWKHECKGGLHASPIVADINHDGVPEIIIGSLGGALIVLTGKGEVIFEFDSSSPIQSVPGVLKGEKTLIIFGNDAGLFTAITPGQETAWQVDLKSKITAAPAFFQTREEKRLVIGNHDGTLFCISEHGEIVWTFKTEGSIYSAAAVEDLDGDGDPEIVFGSCDNTVYALAQDGKKLWSYETDFWVIGTPIIADINHDGKPEVIAGSLDHSVYVLDSQGEFVMDYVPGISSIVPQAGHYSGILTQAPGEQAGKKLFQYKLQAMVMGVQLVEGHGSPKLVVSTKDGKVSSLQMVE